MSATYSLAEVAAELRLDEEMKDPERWLTRQIVRGRIPARRIGRHWRMTRTDIEHALDVFGNRPRSEASEDRTPHVGRPSAASLRRRLAS